MGHPQMRLLYITPETLFGGKYAADLARCYRQKQLIRLIVDEVCRFRSRYLMKVLMSLGSCDRCQLQHAMCDSVSVS